MVCTAALWPSAEMPRNVCECPAATMALWATSMAPFVPFLKPMGMERPLAS